MDGGDGRATVKIDAQDMKLVEAAATRLKSDPPAIQSLGRCWEWTMGRLCRVTVTAGPKKSQKRPGVQRKRPGSRVEQAQLTRDRCEEIRPSTTCGGPPLLMAEVVHE